jgi:hypothetical protein
LNNKSFLTQQKVKLNNDEPLLNNNNNSFESTLKNKNTEPTTNNNTIKKNLKLIDLTEPNDVNRTSSVLDSTWSETKLDLKDLPKLYAALSKQNLTSN